MKAAVFVVMKMCEIAPGSAAIVDPGLKPNQPSHSTKQPMTPEVMLWAGIGCDLAVRRVLAEARPEHQDAGQRRPAADAVHDGRSGEIPEAGRRQPAAAPDPVAGDRIDERDQQKREDDEREVLDPFGHRAGHDRRGRSGKDELEEELREERNAGPRDRLVGASVGVTGGGTVVGTADQKQAFPADRTRCRCRTSGPSRTRRRPDRRSRRR